MYKRQTQPLPEAITDHVVAPLVISIVQLILVIVLMSICLFLVRKFAWTLSGLRRIPIIGPANTLSLIHIFHHQSDHCKTPEGAKAGAPLHLSPGPGRCRELIWIL